MNWVSLLLLCEHPVKRFSVWGKADKHKEQNVLLVHRRYCFIVVQWCKQLARTTADSEGMFHDSKTEKGRFGGLAGETATKSSIRAEGVKAEESKNALLTLILDSLTLKQHVS